MLQIIFAVILGFSLLVYFLKEYIWYILLVPLVLLIIRFMADLYWMVVEENE